MIKRKHFLRNS